MGALGKVILKLLVVSILIFNQNYLFGQCESSVTFTSPLSLTITFDAWPEESSWDIRLGDTSIILNEDYASAGDDLDNSTIAITVLDLVPAVGYTFNFYDAFVDGICCKQGNGSFLLTDAEGTVIFSGGEFESKISHTFCISGDLCSNGLKDNGEQGIDCGGECSECPPTCNDPSAHNYDPLSVNNSDKECLTCDDGELNGDETGVDCGGILCEPCPCGLENNLSVRGAISGDMVVQVGEDLVSDQSIAAGSNVTFVAGNSVTLEAGFEIGVGATLEVSIETCED